MFKYLIAVSLVLCCEFAQSQNSPKVDSLLKVLEKEKIDSLKVKTLIDLCNKIVFTDPKQSLEYGKQALLISEKIKWDKGIAFSYAVIGVAYDDQGNFPEALAYRTKEFKKWMELNNEEKACKVLGNIGSSYSDQGKYVKALEFYISSLKIAEKKGFKETIVSNLCNMASLHRDQGNLKKAYEYFYKSLKLAEENGLEKFIAIDNGNIGSLQSDEGFYARSLASYFKALRIDEKLGNKRNISVWTLNIASTYQLQSDSAGKAGNFVLMKEKNDKSLEYFFKALKMAEELNNIYLQTNILGNIGAIYITNGRYKEAENYLQKSLALAGQINAFDEVIIDYQRFSSLYKKMNKPQEALESYEKYVLIKDSIFNETNKKSLAEMQIKYEIDKKETENKVLAQQNKIQSLIIDHKRNTGFALAGLLILVLIVGFLIIRQNKLKSKQTAVQLEQKLLRAQMNPHFIFNSLANIESFIYDNQPKEAGDYFSKFSRLMRLILENSASEYITLEKEVETLDYYLSLQKLRLDFNLDYKIEVDPGIQTSQIKLPPMLTQPFIENAIEHGFRGISEKGKITVSFNLIDTDLQIKIIDNGIGIVEAQKQRELYKTHASMAIQITQERIKFLNRSKRSKLSFEITDLFDESKKSSGTQVVFSIPI